MHIPSHSITSPGFTVNAKTIFKLGAIYAVIGGVIGFVGRMKAGQAAILSGSYAIASVIVNFSVNHCLDTNSRSAKILKAISCLILSTATIVGLRVLAGMGNAGTVLFGSFTILNYISSMNNAMKSGQVEREDAYTPGDEDGDYNDHERASLFSKGQDYGTGS